MSKLTAVLLAAASVTSCKHEPAVSKQPLETGGDHIERAAFNRMAAELNLPLFWFQDDDGAPEPEEIAVLFGFGTNRSEWIDGGRFTPRFETAKADIAERLASEQKLPRRLALVRRELAQGRPTLIRTDLTKASSEEKTVVRNILDAALLIERIYARQKGVLGMKEEIPADDTMSRMLFHRNQGPWCQAPKTEEEKGCSALDPPPRRISGLYPRALQEEDPSFCEALAKREDGDRLLHQFHAVVSNRDGSLTALPYSKIYEEEMQAIAGKLDAAAAAIPSGEEAAFREYLSAAADAFRTNDWEPADEAWARMSSENSKWYLRIGPDEVYFEPCNRKAGFHVTFARIDRSSKLWQQRLDPVKGKMEAALARLAGDPYQAREVHFDLPDFIQIIVNAGDARRALGATVGQSLPNWGPVANEGRGRTVAMMNVNTDPDSVDAVERQAKSLLCPRTFAAFDRDPSSLTMSTVLHEAAHNLGPAHEYEVGGKTDDEVFGGPVASVLEELKAETASYYFADWLAAEGLISREAANRAHVRDLIWGFHHIGRGLRDPDGKPKTYSFVAAIQDGFWLKEKAAVWKPKETAANGSDIGCLELDLEKMPEAIEKLMGKVAGIKARGDADLANALIKEMVDEPKTDLLEIVEDRWGREAEASLVYSVRM